MRSLTLGAAALVLVAALGFALWPSEPPAEVAPSHAASEPFATAPSPSAAAAAPLDAEAAPPVPSGLGGRVLDARGDPVAGAVVVLSRPAEELLGGVSFDTDGCGANADTMLARLDALGDAAPAETVTTAADGTFRFATAAGERHLQLVSATAGGLSGSAFSNAPRIAIALAPEVHAKGLVRDSNDAPVPGAQVLALAGTLRRATTGADGRFELDVPAGTIELLTWKKGLLPAYSLAATTGSIELLSSVRRRVSGHVTLRGRPVAGAKVRASQRTCSLEATAAANGSFALDGLAAQTTTLTAQTGDAFATLDLELAEGDARDVVLALDQGDFVDATVVDGATGEPIDGVGLVVTLGQRHARFETDLVGRAELGPLAAGEYELDLDAPGWAARRQPPLVVARGVRSTLEVKLSRPVRFRGTVVDEQGRGVGTASVSNGASWEPAKSDGTFEVVAEDADAGLRVTAPMFLGWHGYPDPSSAVRVVLSRGLSLIGRVLDSRGRGVAGALVRDDGDGMLLRDGLARQELGTLSGPNGDFVLTGMSSGSTRRLYAQSPDEPGRKPRSTRKVTVMPREGVESRVTLVFEAEWTATGFAHDIGGAPMTNVEIRAICGTTLLRSHSDGSGRFVLELNGECWIRGFKPGWDSERQVVKPGAPPLDVMMKRVASVRGQVVSSTGEPVRRFSVNATRFDDDDGRFEVTREYDTLTLSADGYADKLLRLSSEEHVDVGRVVLRRQRTVTGRVLDPAGARLADAQVGIADSNAETSTGAAGEFSISAAQGDVVLVVRDERFADTRVAVPANVARVEIRMARGARVHGLVVDPSGTPVTCGAVDIGDRRSDVGEGGAWSISGVSGETVARYVPLDCPGLLITETKVSAHGDGEVVVNLTAKRF